MSERKQSEENQPPARSSNSRSQSSSSRGSRRDSRPPSSNSGKKAIKRSSSDSPSASATNNDGVDQLNKLLRSVLHHPLGLPLLYAFHREDLKEPPELLKSMFPTQDLDIDSIQKPYGIDTLLSKCYNEWMDQNVVPREPSLTKKLRDKMEEMLGRPYKMNPRCEFKVEDKTEGEYEPDGRIDITFTTQNPQQSNEVEPTMVMEFGLCGDDWFKKLSQGIQYVKRLCHPQGNENLQFKRPMLLAIVTIDKKTDKKTFFFRMGVFLCSRKQKDIVVPFRMSLLYYTATKELEKASNRFGRMLTLSANFHSWRLPKENKLWEEEWLNGGTKNNYEYLSSNCCRLGENVLRIYDNRVRETERSSTIYLDPECAEIVGCCYGKSISFEDENVLSTSNVEKKKALEIVVTPYREGSHRAEQPKDFIPIIDQLQKLHENGYVHGDIRGFNVVFGRQEDGGGAWLIDFDFGGTPGEVTYPSGYKRTLDDGTRIGKEGKPITKDHDWYALGHLIFVQHDFPDIVEKELLVKDFLRQRAKWTRKFEVSSKDVEALKSFLSQAEENECVLTPSDQFEDALNELDKSKGSGTHVGATGSPPKKGGLSVKITNAAQE